jgi:hypothetical protein
VVQNTDTEIQAAGPTVPRESAEAEREFEVLGNVQTRPGTIREICGRVHGMEPCCVADRVNTAMKVDGSALAAAGGCRQLAHFDAAGSGREEADPTEGAETVRVAVDSGRFGCGKGAASVDKNGPAAFDSPALLEKAN